MDPIEIKNILYTKGLYNDVINLIIDYSKPTLKEQCLDPKSLKRYAKHQKWLHGHAVTMELFRGLPEYFIPFNYHYLFHPTRFPYPTPGMWYSTNDLLLLRKLRRKGSRSETKCPSKL